MMHHPFAGETQLQRDRVGALTIGSLEQAITQKIIQCRVNRKSIDTCGAERVRSLGVRGM